MFKFSTENELKIHQAIVALYGQVTGLARPLGKKEISKLVAGKPVSWEEMRKIGLPEGFEEPPGAEPFIARRVWRDPVISALASKAATTKEAVALLVEAGCGADAYALCRNLLENVIVLLWLLPEDEARRNTRIDTYIHHLETFLVRLSEVDREGAEFLAKHGFPRADNTEPVSERTRELSRDLFDDKWVTWAWFTDVRGKRHQVRLREMAEEVGLNREYARDYFLMSGFVHSAPSVTSQPGIIHTFYEKPIFVIDPELFKLSGFGEKALFSSNYYMAILLETLNKHFGLQLEKQMREIQAMWFPTSDETK